MWQRWRDRAEALLRQTLYVHGINCAARPLLVIYASFLVVTAFSYPAAVYLDRAINGPAGYEPAAFWSRGSSHSEPTLQEEAVAEAFGNLQAPYLRIDQVFFGLGSSIETSVAAADTYLHGVIERELLHQVLALQAAISNFTAPDGTTLQAICFQPAGDGRCLVNSPLEFWGNDAFKLRSDRHIRRTLSDRNFRSSFQTLVSLRSVFGSAAFNETSGEIDHAASIVVSYFTSIRSPQEQAQAREFWYSFWTFSAAASELRVKQAAVDVRYFVYKFHQTDSSDDFAELALLAMAYVLVFLYFTLALGRVELVKSKAGLGLSAVATVFGSLLMSVGICSLVGVQITLVPWEVLPFLVIFVGVENTAKLTKAVVSTSIDLPVKERIAVGLSEAGPSMTRVLLSELALLSAGRLLSIPSLHEFCFFASVAVVMDYLLHMTLCVAVLSMDIRRLELSDLHDQRLISLIRASSSPNLAPMGKTTSSSPTLLPNDAETVHDHAKTSLKRPVALCFVLLLLLMCVLALSFGSTTYFAKATNTTFSWDASMRNAADDFWMIVNPSQQDLYVEIRPPVHVTLDPPQRRRPPNSRPQPSAVVTSPLPDTSVPAATPAVDEPDGPPGMHALPISSWPYWLLLLSTWMPSLLPYLHQAGPLVVIFATATITACFFITAVIASTMWPTIMASFRRKQAAAVAPEWAVGPFRETVLAGHEDEIECLDGGGTGDALLVTAGLDRTVQLWDTASGSRLHLIRGFPATVWQVRLHGDVIAVGCADGTLTLLSAATGKLLKQLHTPAAEPSQPATRAHRAGVSSLAVDVADEVLISGSDDRTIKGWLLQTGAHLFTLEGPRTPVTQLLAHGSLLLAGYADGSIRVHTLAGVAAPICRLTLHGHVGAVTCLIVARRNAQTSAEDDRPLLVSASQDGQIRVWDVSRHATAGSCLATLSAHTNAVVAMAVDEPTNLLASAALDETVALWDLDTFRCVYRKSTPAATALAVRDSVLVMGEVGASRAAAAAAAAAGGSSGGDAQWRSRWGAPRHAGMSLLDLRTQTVLRRSMPLRARGNSVDNMLHSLVFVGDVLVANCGDNVALVHLSCSRVEKKIK